jgi:predicted nucleic acid-binding protein
MAFSTVSGFVEATDAAYLDVAMREGLPLASLDNELIRSAERSGVMLFQP